MMECESAMHLHKQYLHDHVTWCSVTRVIDYLLITLLVHNVHFVGQEMAVGYRQ